MRRPPRRDSPPPVRRRFLGLLAGLLLALIAGSALAAAAGPSGEPTGPATSTDVALLVTYVLLALVFSFLCSVAEAVLLSLTPTYIMGLRAKKPELAELLQKLKIDDVDRSLAAILTLNTIAHTVGAIGSGSKATAVFGSAWFGAFSAVMTLLILFLSEIVPKTLGAVYWKRLAWPTAQFIRGLILALYPLIWVSESLTRLIARDKKGHGFSRDEFLAMAGIGAQTGQLAANESRVIRNLFRFGALRAADIMTPRTVVMAFPQNQTVGETLGDRTDLPFSRLPIYDGDLDHVTGFVLKDDLLRAMSEGQGDAELVTLRRDLPSLAEGLSLSGLLEFLLDHRQHVALVRGEYGEVRGLVTLEDAVETLLGQEIVDESDQAEDMRALARQRWEQRRRELTLDGATGLSDDESSD